MSGSLSNLNRRLAKVEQQVADRAGQKKLATCNCYPKDPEASVYPSSSRIEKSLKRR
jgi:hypothetical protein